jgi:hypothetical protein
MVGKAGFAIASGKTKNIRAMAEHIGRMRCARCVVNVTLTEEIRGI